MTEITVRQAIKSDVPVILNYIFSLARYEKCENLVAATEEKLIINFGFDDKSPAYVKGFIAEDNGKVNHFHYFYYIYIYILFIYLFIYLFMMKY